MAPPDINLSTDEMEIDYANQKIRAKFGIIRGMASATIDPIVAGRPYKDIQDFVNRDVAGPAMSRKLIHVGVLDSLFPANSKVLQKLQLFEDALEIKKYNKRPPKPKKDGTVPPIPKGEIPKEYLQMQKTPMINAAIQKSVLPSLFVGLYHLGQNHSKCLKNPASRPSKNMQVTNIDGEKKEVLLISGEFLQHLNEMTGDRVGKDLYVAVTAFIVGTKIQDYSNNTKQMLKVIMDCDGYVKEHVLWPNYFTQELVYPKDLAKGKICTVFLKKRAGKDDPCTITNIVIEA